MTAYGLLTYTLLGDVASALPVVKWLSQQRNALGGFSSTQVALFPFPDVADKKLSLLKTMYVLLIPELKCCIDFCCLQDTCVALHALSEYAILSYVGGVNLTISLASTNLDFQETFELNRNNKKLLQSAKVVFLCGESSSFFLHADQLTLTLGLDTKLIDFTNYH